MEPQQPNNKNNPFYNLIDLPVFLLDLKTKVAEIEKVLPELKKRAETYEVLFRKIEIDKAEMEKLKPILAYLLQGRFEIKEQLFVEQQLQQLREELDRFRESAS